VENVDVLSDEWSADINVVSGALKLWFRELPEPLLTYGLYHQFVEAARGYSLHASSRHLQSYSLDQSSPMCNGYIADESGYENDRLRHIRLHEQVNELPDPNYATLKFFMGHLNKFVYDLLYVSSFLGCLLYLP
jgi:hypothetical protein